MVEAGFKSDDQLIMFPAGLCSRRQNGVIRDLDWKKTFIVKSVQFQRDVIPVHFEGRNSDFFYNLANLCKALGIKFNIAMLYLADEMLKIAIKHSPSLSENPFRGKHSISRKLRQSGHNM